MITAESASPSVAGIFETVVSRATYQSAMVLSAALVTGVEQLQAALVSLLGVTQSHASEIVDELRSWPFVLGGEATLHIESDVASELAAALRASDLELYVETHRFFSSVEEQAVGVDGASVIDTWTRRSRIAYYLAEWDQPRSIETFADLFEHPPALDRFYSRIYLSDLVIRKSEAFGTRSRVVAFYQGFLEYSAGKFSEARRSFERVIDGERDSHTAIALHVHALCLHPPDSKAVIRELEDSVSLSSQLGLLENEVMARNSLVWSRIRRAENGAGAFSDELGHAIRESRANVTRVNQSGKRPDLVTWVYRAAAVATWTEVLGADKRGGLKSDARGRATAVTRQLEDAIEAASFLHDVDSELGSWNVIAGVWRDVGEVELALAALEKAIEIVKRVVNVDLEIIAKLAKTAGSLAARDMGSAEGARLVQVRFILDELRATPA